MYVSTREMLNKAKQENYAVMAINCFNIETARTVIHTAEMMNAPIIINIVQEHLVKHANSNIIAPVVKVLAEKATVPVALNLDHGQNKEVIYQAIEDGFSSVMYDCSHFDFEKNTFETMNMVKYAHARGISVEAELGSLDGSEGENIIAYEMQTDPSEAEEFARKTGIDILAISYGSAHGDYPEGTFPEFDFDRLREIRKRVNIPLGLHGGSGSGEENILKSVEYGINKINVGCDFMNSNRDHTLKILNKVPNINYFDLIHRVEQESSGIIKHYIELSGSKNKAI
jgi:fructose-bisphosphate aldolase class II